MPEPTEAPANLTVPEDLSTLEPAELTTLRESCQAALDELANAAETDPSSVTAEDGARAGELAGAIAALGTEIESREAVQAGHVQAVLDARGTVATEPEPVPEENPAPAEGEPAPAESVEAPAEEAPVEAVAAAARRAPLTVAARPRAGTMNPAMSMADIARNAPAPDVPARPDMAELVITAAGNLPTRGGQRLESLNDLVAAFGERARTMAVTSGNGSPMPVASIARNYEHVIGEGASLAEVEAAFAELTRAPATRSGMEALVAAGGWCAPSEIDYSFWDVTGPPTGQIEIPTVGIRRGGLRWPESLDLAQFFGLSGVAASGVATNATMPWLWTETDDILAATGDTPVKSCLRPPCPDFNEERLWLLGICVLAGNLTQDAYPEVIRHYLALVQVAHARVMNRRHGALMDAHPTIVAQTPTMGASSSATTHFLGALELAATSERLRLGMPENAVMQVDIPVFLRGLLRSDLAKRNAWDDLSVADSWIMRQLDLRNLRGVFTEDWQHATGWAAPAGTMGADTAPVAWPSSFYVRMYPPGHFFRGGGMNLNLGVVRDSVLNAQNDFTAAWSEEASMIGARGNRALRINFANMFAAGTTGAQVAGTVGA